MSKCLLLGLFLISTSAAAEILPLPRCDGHVRVERNDLQTVVRIEEVVHCPYVLFNETRHSMSLEADGRYSHFFVWHEQDQARGRALMITLHSADGETEDRLWIESAAQALF